MPAVTKHYMADEIGRLIEQLGRWPGWNGRTSTQSTLSWIADFQSRKRQDEYGPSMPVLGGEAADTAAALQRIPSLLAECLTNYYTVPGTVERKLGLVNRRRRGADKISRKTYYRHVDAAHPAFWEAYMGLRANARMVNSANVIAGTHAGAAVARRHRLVAAPIGLVSTSPEGAEVHEKTGVASVVYVRSLK